jgi:hypothetical protein
MPPHARAREEHASRSHYNAGMSFSLSASGHHRHDHARTQPGGELEQKVLAFAGQLEAEGYHVEKLELSGQDLRGKIEPARVHTSAPGDEGVEPVHKHWDEPIRTARA